MNRQPQSLRDADFMLIKLLAFGDGNYCRIGGNVFTCVDQLQNFQ
jgi:hypothetical protein